MNKFLKETNGLAIFSFLIAAFAWVLMIFGGGEYSQAANGVGFGAALLGIAALFWIKIKKQKGQLFAISGILIGSLVFMLVCAC